MQQRIEAMIAGVATVQPPLDKFYGLVNDEQKARLNARRRGSGEQNQKARQQVIGAGLRHDRAVGPEMAG